MRSRRLEQREDTEFLLPVLHSAHGETEPLKDPSQQQDQLWIPLCPPAVPTQFTLRKTASVNGNGDNMTRVHRRCHRERVAPCCR